MVQIVDIIICVQWRTCYRAIDPLMKNMLEEVPNGRFRTVRSHKQCSGQNGPNISTFKRP